MASSLCKLSSKSSVKVPQFFCLHHGVPTAHIGTIFASEFTIGINSMAASGSILRVGDLMSCEIEWGFVNESCVAAAQKMIKRTVGVLPIKDHHGKLCGIVTDRDIVTRIIAAGLNPREALISSAMTSTPLISVFDSDNLDAARKAMLKGDVRRLLVRSQSSGEVIGLLSIDDLARAGMKKMAGEVLRETAVLHRERQAIPSISVSGDLAGASDIDKSAENSVSLAINRLVEWVEASESIRTASLRMLHRPGRLVGLLTDRDIVVRLVAADRDPDTTKARDIMTTELAWCYIDDQLADAQHVMIERGVRRLPVLLKSTHELLGILSVDDIALWSSKSRAGAVLRASVQAAAPAEFPKSSAEFQPEIA